MAARAVLREAVTSTQILRRLKRRTERPTLPLASFCFFCSVSSRSVACSCLSIIFVLPFTHSFVLSTPWLESSVTSFSTSFGHGRTSTRKRRKNSSSVGRSE